MNFEHQEKEFLNKIDKTFFEIETRFKSVMSCQKGCTSCCKSGLTVSAVEAKRILKFLDTYPYRRELIKKQDLQENACEFLDKDGACLIYEVRPVICRTHGVPLEWEDEAGKFRDVCPLNFKDQDILELSSENVIRMDTVNTILACFNNALGADPEERIPLKRECF